MPIEFKEYIGVGISCDGDKVYLIKQNDEQVRDAKQDMALLMEGLAVMAKSMIDSGNFEDVEAAVESISKYLSKAIPTYSAGAMQ